MSKRTSSNGDKVQRTKLNDDARLRDQAALAKLGSSSDLEHIPGRKLESVAGSSKPKRFHIPEKEVTPGEYTPGKKNPIHSILTALPVLMLIVGLYYFYRGESKQASGVPIIAESIEVHGTFLGLSEVKSGTEGQHFLWLTEETRKRGVRIQASEVALFADRERGLPMQIDMAPTVAGSSTYWAWRVTLNGELLLERNIVDGTR